MASARRAGVWDIAVISRYCRRLASALSACAQREAVAKLHAEFRNSFTLGESGPSVREVLSDVVPAGLELVQAGQRGHHVVVQGSC